MTDTSLITVTVDLIVKGTSGYARRYPQESLQSYLKRITHLSLGNRFIHDVRTEDLGMCKNLLVLYLYDNLLPKIPLLARNTNLTHLYLQNNEIDRMENLNVLVNLQKLFLSGNKISIVEGVDRLKHLQELHLENQKLQPGDTLIFDPRAIQALSDTLQLLNISDNNIETLESLKLFRQLTQLSCSNNKLTNVAEVGQIVSGWPLLARLDLKGNPLCEQHKYKEQLILLCSSSLEYLDGKQIAAQSRQFLRSLSEAKQQRRRIKSEIPRRPLIRGSAAPKMKSNSAGFAVPGFRRSKQFEEVLARSRATSGRQVQDSVDGELGAGDGGGAGGETFDAVQAQPSAQLIRLKAQLATFESEAAGDGAKVNYVACGDVGNNDIEAADGLEEGEK